MGCISQVWCNHPYFGSVDHLLCGGEPYQILSVGYTEICIDMGCVPQMRLDLLTA